jgi:hypothetical protein
LDSWSAQSGVATAEQLWQNSSTTQQADSPTNIWESVPVLFALYQYWRPLCSQHTLSAPKLGKTKTLLEKQN